jgi:predicted O-methyltransferase YrrM
MELIDNIVKNIFTCVTKEELLKLNELANGRKIAIEIGSYLGASTIAIADTIEKQLFAVDIWKPAPDMRPNPKEGTLFENFMKNTKEYKDKIIPIVDYSYNAINYFLKNNIKADFLFVDGDHSEKGVSQDWKLYYPILKKGAIAVFHDWSWGSVKHVIQEKVMPLTIGHNNLPNMWWGTVK